MVVMVNDTECYIKCVLMLVMMNGPLARYVKLRVAHAPGMPGTFSPPPRVSDPDMYHGTCVTHVPWCMSGSLTSDFLSSRWRGKRSRHSRSMRDPQFYVSCKRPMIVPIISSAIWWLREGMPHIMQAIFCWFDDEWSAHYTWTLCLCVMILVMNDTATHTSASAQRWLWWWMISHIIPVYLRDDGWGENLNRPPYRSCCVMMVVVLNDTTHHTSCISLQWSAINNPPT